MLHFSALFIFGYLDLNRKRFNKTMLHLPHWIKLIFTTCILSTSFYSYGQLYVLKDHRPEVKKITKCDSVSQLSDSVFNKIMDVSFDSLKLYMPDKNSLFAAIDSMSPEMTSTMQNVRYQYITGSMYKRYKKFHKDAKANGIKFKGIVVMKQEEEYGVHPDGHHYAYVTLECIRKTKIFTISFLAIKLGEVWYLGDELRMGPPKKLRKIDLKKYEKYIPDMG